MSLFVQGQTRTDYTRLMPDTSGDALCSGATVTDKRNKPLNGRRVMARQSVAR
jgi:hypothetical protein